VISTKNILLADGKIHVLHQCRKTILATYREPKKILWLTQVTLFVTEQ